MDTFLEVLKWLGIALAAGFVGYFGRVPAKILVDKITGTKKTAPERTSSKDEGEKQLELERSRLKVEKKAAKQAAKIAKKAGKKERDVS